MECVLSKEIEELLNCDRQHAPELVNKFSKRF